MKNSRFSLITLQLQKFYDRFLHMNTIKADNHGHFLGMKVKTWNSESFSLQIINNIIIVSLCTKIPGGCSIEVFYKQL